MEIRRTWEAIDEVGREPFDRVVVESGVTVPVSRRTTSIHIESEKIQVQKKQASETTTTKGELGITDEAHRSLPSDEANRTLPLAIEEDVLPVQEILPGQMLLVKLVISGDSGGAMATYGLDIGDKKSAISMTEEDQRQILDELEILWDIRTET